MNTNNIVHKVNLSKMKSAHTKITAETNIKHYCGSAVNRNNWEPTFSQLGEK
jgi:hypothetical protein